MIRVTAYSAKNGLTKTDSLEGARAALADEKAVIWVHFDRRSETSDAILEQLFGFHPLAIEDVYKGGHRPKVEDYHDYLYLIVHALADGEPDPALPELRELDLFLGSNFLVSHSDGAATAFQAVAKRLDQDPKAIARGPAFLAHAILDQVIDRFRPFGDAYGKVLEQLEDRVLAKRGAVEGEESLEQILELTRALVRLRRLAIAQRHVLTRLAQAEFDEIPADSQPFFRDVSEHFVEFHDDVEVHLDEARALFEAFHSLSSYRMNEVMRLLTVISTIVLPLTFVTGVYGMNFPNMPEFSVPHSYELAWGIMISLSLVQVIWFRRRGWL
ncbi:MAG: magnesium/cobalt transporter CorA [Planctomycetes bacterium]|nr:magnesium/cobalt transporter CorA [Planctomycetota bacterium]